MTTTVGALRSGNTSISALKVLYSPAANSSTDATSISSRCYDSLASVQAGEYLVAVAVSGAEGDFLLLVAGRVQLDIYEVVTLFLRDGLYGQADYTVTLFGEQPDLSVCSGEYVIGGVDGECHGDVGVGLVCGAAVSEQAAVESGGAEHLVRVGKSEVGGFHSRQAAEISFGYVGLEIHAVAREYSGQGCSDRYVVTFFNKAGLHISAGGRLDSSTVAAAVCRKGFICQAGCLITAFCGLVFLAGDDIVLYQLGSSLVFFLCCLICDAGPLYRVSVLKVAGRDGEHRGTFIDEAAFHEGGSERHYAWNVGHDCRLVAGCRHYPSAYLKYASELAGHYRLCLDSGRCRALGTEDYLIGRALAL